MTKIKPASEKPGSTDSINSEKLGLQLQAILAEYSALRSEIQYRSGFQNRLIEIHISALTVILGASITQAFGPWALLLIPIESSIFGLWYIDHALVIGEIGEYIRKFIETRISLTLNAPQLLSWEAGFRAGIDAVRRRRVITFGRLLFLTFAVPSIVSLVISLALLALSNQQIGGIVQAATGLQIATRYTWPESLIAFVGWIAGVVLTIAFRSAAAYWSTVSDLKASDVKNAIENSSNTELKPQ